MTSEPIEHDVAAPIETHLVPSLELSGSRREQVRALDAFIDRLERLRRALAEGRPARPEGHEYASPYIGSPSWPWFTAGIVLGASFVLLMLLARSCA
jgi:hypothetical protein